MYEGQKVVCVTPAGRRRYLSILQQYVRRDFGLIDEWHLWVNTGDVEDLAYLRCLASEDPRVGLLTCDTTVPFCSGRIGSFLPYAAEPDVIYVRFDDDVVWVQEGAVERLIRYKLANPQLFLVGGNVLNNPVSTFRQCRVGALALPPVDDAYNDLRGLTDFHGPVHEQFLAEPNKQAFYFPSEVLPVGQRFGIHFICWEGNRFAQFGGRIPHLDEENWLTNEAPLQFGEATGLCGDALAVHYAYSTQRIEGGGSREYGFQDPNPDLLERYRQLITR